MSKKKRTRRNQNKRRNNNNNFNKSFDLDFPLEEFLDEEGELDLSESNLIDKLVKTVQNEWQKNAQKISRLMRNYLKSNDIPYSESKDESGQCYFISLLNEENDEINLLLFVHEKLGVFGFTSIYDNCPKKYSLLYYQFVSYLNEQNDYGFFRYNQENDELEFRLFFPLVDGIINPRIFDFYFNMTLEYLAEYGKEINEAQHGHFSEELKDQVAQDLNEALKLLKPKKKED